MFSSDGFVKACGKFQRCAVESTILPRRALPAAVLRTQCGLGAGNHPFTQEAVAFPRLHYRVHMGGSHMQYQQLPAPKTTTLNNSSPNMIAPPSVQLIGRLLHPPATLLFQFGRKRQSWSAMLIEESVNAASGTSGQPMA